MKTYCKPSIRVKELNIDASIMAASDPIKAPDLDGVDYKGLNDKNDREVDSKSFSNSSPWDDDEE